MCTSRALSRSWRVQTPPVRPRPNGSCCLALPDAYAGFSFSIALCCFDRVTGKGAHVLGALESARVGAVLLAQTAAKLLDRHILVLFQPHGEIAFDNSDVLDAMPDQHRTEHRHIGSGHEHFRSEERRVGKECRSRWS